MRKTRREEAVMAQGYFDPERYRWRKVEGEGDLSYKVSHEYTILGADVDAGTLDMVVRWQGDGGHCPLHRHTSVTTILVIEGEQHLWDMLPDGERGKHTVRQAGDYALTLGDGLPHLERGGDRGGLAFFGCHAQDGLLYEILADDMSILAPVTVESLMADWEENA